MPMYSAFASALPEALPLVTNLTSNLTYWQAAEAAQAPASTAS